MNELSKEDHMKAVAEGVKQAFWELYQKDSFFRRHIHDAIEQGVKAHLKEINWKPAS